MEIVLLTYLNSIECDGAHFGFRIPSRAHQSRGAVSTAIGVVMECCSEGEACNASVPEMPTVSGHREASLTDDMFVSNRIELRLLILSISAYFIHQSAPRG